MIRHIFQRIIVIVMLVFVALLFTLNTEALSQTAITLTTNETVYLYSNATSNPNFILKKNNFDCSSFLYAYSQTSQQYRSPTPFQVNIINATTAFSIMINTVYGHFQPFLSQNMCEQTSCSINLYQNCPSQLNSYNYFDIIQINIENVGIYSFYLRCNTSYNPFYLQWGQFIIAICATLTLIFASIYSKISAFGNFAIQYSFKWIIIVVCSMLFFGLMTLFLPPAAAIIYEALSWIIGTLGTSLIAIQVLFKFVKIKLIQKELYSKEVRIRVLDIIGGAIGLSMMLGWWFSSKNWIVSDIISVCMAISFIKAFKFVSFKMALVSYILINLTYILGTILTPLLQKQNLIIYFLLKVNNPFQFQMPLILPSYSQNCSYIPIASIFLPGLMVSYLRRFDRCRTTNIYLITTTSAYFVGSLLWNIINIFSIVPIPFDLIVQGIMIVAFSLFAFKRKELRTIWEGTFYDEEFVNKVQIQMLNTRLSVQGSKDDSPNETIGRQLFFNLREDQRFKDKFEDIAYTAMKDKK